jgi:hypothetical protein
MTNAVQRHWSSTGTAAADRRRSPRVEIFGRLHGHLVALDVPVKVTGVSLGGLSFESSVDFPIGAVHEFRLALNEVASVRLKGRIVHCRLVSMDKGEPQFATGVEFHDEHAESNLDGIRDLIERVRTI